MSEIELSNKVKELSATFEDLGFRLKRVRKLIKNCLETCHDTVSVIGEFNDNLKNNK